MRKGSFRAAADELLVTPQAVSQQIKLLEDILAVPLFDRKGRVIEPTEQAIVLSHFVEAGFAELSEGVRRITRVGHRNRITLNVSPYFATHYLMQRLGSFRRTVPGVDLRMTTMVELPDFTKDEVDASIQWGFDRWKDFDCTLLVRDPKILCCTPELAAGIRTARDLSGQTLLHPMLSRGLWNRVLQHLAVEAFEGVDVMEFHDAATMRRATLSGLGIGLISRPDALRDIEAGKVIAPLGVDALSGMPDADVPGFYLVVPRAHKRVRTVAAFCDWIAGEDWTDILDEV